MSAGAGTRYAELTPQDRELTEALHRSATPALFMHYATGGRFVIRPHIDAMDEAILEALEPDGRLIITGPPRHSKTSLVSRALPAWYLGTFPERAVILASYGATFAAEHGAAARDLLVSHGKDVWGVTVDRQKAARAHWGLLDHRGGMRSVGVRGPITGTGANLLLIDDPVKNDVQANSVAWREGLTEWMRSVALTRLEPGGSAILTMTRWHEEDLVAFLLRMPGPPWKLLRLPALALEDDPLDREVGEPLWPGRFGVEALDQIKEQVGPYWWAALYQGMPSAPEGEVFQRDWFTYWHLDEMANEYVLPDIESDRRYPVSACPRFALMDTADSTSTSADFTVVMTVAFTPAADILVLDVQRKRQEFPDHERMLSGVWSLQHPTLFGIEDKTYGSALIKSLRRTSHLPIKPIKVDSDKVTRARLPAARYAAQKIRHRAGASWVPDLESELTAFRGDGRHAHDDQVDCLSMAAKLAVDGITMTARTSGISRTPLVGPGARLHGGRRSG